MARKEKTRFGRDFFERKCVFQREATENSVTGHVCENSNASRKRGMKIELPPLSSIQNGVKIVKMQLFSAAIGVR